MGSQPKQHDPDTAAERLTRRFFRRDPATVARALLGQTLVRVLPSGTRLTGTIVETEAYLGAPDRAAHTHNHHRSPRNETMYADGGHAYVYFTYGMHHCVNVVTQTIDIGTAVLLRAIQPTEGIDTMKLHRAGKITLDRLRDTDLCSGPAKLTQSLAIDRDLDGTDLLTSPVLYIEKAPRIPPARIVTTPRIGIDSAGTEWAGKPLRFYVKDNPHVSRR